MSNLETVSYIGVDVGKAKLDYYAGKRERGELANNAEGLAALLEVCKGKAKACVVCEATGGYEQLLLTTLSAAGVKVKRAHPNRVRAFVRSEGVHAKTDRIDAELLQRYGESRPMEKQWRPPREAEQKLRSLLEVRDGLVEQRKQVRNRQELSDATQREWLERQEQFLNAEVEKVDEAIDTHLANDAQLRQDTQRLQGVCGVGRQLAASVLAYLPELRQLSEREAASLAGVAPHPHSSGQRERRRRVQGGRQAVKKVLYMSSVSAIQHNRILKAFYQRLRAKGKAPKVCLVAVMRKLICLLTRLLSNPNFILA